jgi:hypothetical protein
MMRIETRKIRANIPDLPAFRYFTIKQAVRLSPRDESFSVVSQFCNLFPMIYSRGENVATRICFSVSGKFFLNGARPARKTSTLSGNATVISAVIEYGPVIVSGV